MILFLRTFENSDHGKRLLEVQAARQARWDEEAERGGAWHRNVTVVSAEAEERAKTLAARIVRAREEDASLRGLARIIKSAKRVVGLAPDPYRDMNRLLSIAHQRTIGNVALAEIEEESGLSMPWQGHHLAAIMAGDIATGNYFTPDNIPAE